MRTIFPVFLSILFFFSFPLWSQNPLENDYFQKLNNFEITIHENTITPSNTKDRDVPWFVERFKIAAGLFQANSNTSIRVGTNNGKIGTEIDFEDDLGFSTTASTFIANFQWRASSRSRFDLTYYNIRRNSEYTLKKDIEFGDNTYNIDATVNAFFNTQIYRFSYGYAILSKPTFEVGLLFGAHIIGGNVGIGLTTANNELEAEEDLGFTAPLPDFGIWGGVSLSKRFAFNGEFDYLAVEIDNIRGRILAYNFGLTFRAVKQLDLTATYTGMHFRVDAERRHLNGHFVWSYNGPALLATFSFGNKKWH
ncbi:hypothetical protein ACFS5J_01220 [Flavobacterium chuncheonense]|uniref:DUF4421 domain-containing protein n=1 Tax=Flavobacterium chuncheonense TaxID=2026653 RepID=A0ABW5YJG0_9FLAO